MLEGHLMPDSAIYLARGAGADQMRGAGDVNGNGNGNAGPRRPGA
ncbi:hypothetical protein [uncultured Thiodictyon sp.]|nr:hypothetical protein [uncultured Thiodictyon sp.]